ncbi:sulfotransferase family protein [Bacillus toyonensis]|uniref:Sulfotransferase family protein n=1 Tax=Bacillus toyonensis TaxID=155322 RepID=A0A2B5Y5Q4_9BACI|nr:sulfotransferase family protein [Bacillus toyonensis]PGB03770.1 sulfotransferase family protein [Bacillus toyonensis]PHD67132.1 sulfotransferase family protein [Bacillus toyonensis]
MNGVDNLNNLSKRKLFLVLALHRSGSSAVAGVLDLLGVNMGDNLLAATPANAKGYFENVNFVMTNEKILEVLNMTWMTPRLRRKNFESEFQLVQSKLLLDECKNVFSKEIKLIWGLKDPRILLTFDVWKSYLEETSNITYIFVWRPLDESIKSLAYRDNIDLKLAKDILNIYYKNLIYYREELQKTNEDIVDIYFKDLLKEPEIFVQKINLRLNQDNNYNLNLIKEFLDIDLKHF